MSAFCTTALAADAENDVVLWCRDGDVNDGQVVVTETTGSYQLVSTGKSGNGYELYTNTAKTNATRIVGMTATDAILSTHTYYVVEADVKFGSNGDSFQLCVGGNKSGNISKEILSTNANIDADGWNSIKAVVEYASDDAANTSVYINGVLDHTTRSALRKSLIADYNVFRFVADAKDYTSSATFATVDNIKIYLTSYAPTATSLIAVEDNNTIEFRAQGIRGFNQIFATAYDASGNMDGKVYIDDDGTVAVIKREAASVYTGFVWNNTGKLTPICPTKDYQAQ